MTAVEFAGFRKSFEAEAPRSRGANDSYQPQFRVLVVKSVSSENHIDAALSAAPAAAENLAGPRRANMPRRPAPQRFRSAAQVLELSADEIFEAYTKKHQVNLSRQASGYLTKDESDNKHI
ncbi:MAG: hypothetical protein DME33_04965 [Verrucomicrobia bacterium]|nr:MAG: hypothetical protein DME33_04965 [Verrucomicrobiota bacterium]